MASRKDQAQAYFFVVGRLIAGLLHGDPDTLQRPNRRPSVGTVIGVVLAVLVAAGFGIFGLLRPGGTDAWRREAGALILVKETGARYLLIDGQLRPVLNYTSARLALGNGAPVTTVSRDSLRGVPVGTPVGIPGAPDSLPSPDHLYRGAWTICARRVADPAPNGPRARTTLVLGDTPAAAVSPDQAMYVAASDGTVFLVWQGQRYRLASAAVAGALGYGTLDPMPVTAAWMNSVPAGRDLSFPAVDHRGEAGPTMGGRPGVVGQVYEMLNPALTTSELYLLRSTGLALLSRTMAALILADPATKAAYGTAAVRPVPVAAHEVTAAGIRDRTSFVSGYPLTPPEALSDTGSGVPCIRHAMGGASGVPTGAMIAADALRSAVSMTGPGGTSATADEFVIEAGTGVLVRNDVASGTVYLVSEFGTKFPVADSEALAALGYGAVSPVDISSELLRLLPTGAVLSSAAARTSQPVGG